MSNVWAKGRGSPAETAERNIRQFKKKALRNFSAGTRIGNSLFLRSNELAEIDPLFSRGSGISSTNWKIFYSSSTRSRKLTLKTLALITAGSGVLAVTPILGLRLKRRRMSASILKRWRTLRIRRSLHKQQRH